MSQGKGWVIDAEYRDHSVVVMWTEFVAEFPGEQIDLDVGGSRSSK